MLYPIIVTTLLIAWRPRLVFGSRWLHHPGDFSAGPQDRRERYGPGSSHRPNDMALGRREPHLVRARAGRTRRYRRRKFAHSSAWTCAKPRSLSRRPTIGRAEKCGMSVLSRTHTPDAIGKLARRHSVIEFVYEAGSCDYNVQRQLAAWNFRAVFVRPR